MTLRQVQALLVYLGYDTGGVDGVIGQKTEKAVRFFQKEYGGLDVDGGAGQATQKALRKAVGGGWTRPAGKADGWWAEIRYFRRDELGIRCPCPRCGGFPVEPDERLMRTADKIREHFGMAMLPSSTVRCQAHNDELPGSAKNSRHVRGKAMDFAIPGVPVAAVIAYTRQLQAAGEINYTYEMKGTGHVHFDVA